MASSAAEYPRYIEGAIQALLTRGWDAGRQALEPIAYTPRTIVRSRPTTRRQRAQVFMRDRFRCRYCGRKTIFEWVMVLLAAAYPDFFPWHMNWKTGATHPAIAAWSAMVDHVVPLSNGGTSDVANLVTSCSPCNLAKANFTIEDLGWTLKQAGADGWDGLLKYYRPLWEFLGKPNPQLHQSWINEFGL